LERLVAASREGRLALLTFRPVDPTGYGRILRDAQGKVTAIVEERDADAMQKTIREVNSGILAAPAQSLLRWLPQISNHNAKGEYYLTDIIAMAAAENMPVACESANTEQEVLGVNDRVQLAQLERHYQESQAQRLMGEGVTLLDPARFDLRGELQVGRDVVIDVNVVLEGSVSLGEGTRVGPNCLLRDVEVGDGVEIRANCVLEEAVIGPRCLIGPFARIRPGTRLHEGVHIGNFVEVKKSRVGQGSKINHLTYMGDATVGRDVNIGAGTITCNYDGVNKHHTEIGDRAFIGSDTQLVPPVTIGADATIGAGSTITRDAPKGELTLSRSVQKTIRGWRRPEKKPKN
jgi:bifunctional UDP-N-acetylglucosamine pyrophosphorylase/glucosamine-1-phosphate N-acetyltransferase